MQQAHTRFGPRDAAHGLTPYKAAYTKVRWHSRGSLGIPRCTTLPEAQQETPRQEHLRMREAHVGDAVEGACGTGWPYHIVSRPHGRTGRAVVLLSPTRFASTGRHARQALKYAAAAPTCSAA